MSRVAIITGAASGLGLAVATALSQRQTEKWSIYLLDLSSDAGTSAAQSVNGTFYQCDVTDYAALAEAFRQIYEKEHRIDFVHANAGIIGVPDFFVAHETDSQPPPPLSLKVVDVNFTSVAMTSYLALHYFRVMQKKPEAKVVLEEENWQGNLVLTASMASLYPNNTFPIYSATKHGVLGLCRAIAGKCHQKFNIRVNCVCPGGMRTNLIAPLLFPECLLTPVDSAVQAVLMLLDGKTAVDGKGVEVVEGEMYGRAVEVNKDKFYFREMPEYSDEDVREIMDLSNGDWDWSEK